MQINLHVLVQVVHIAHTDCLMCRYQQLFRAQSVYMAYNANILLCKCIIFGELLIFGVYMIIKVSD